MNDEELESIYKKGNAHSHIIGLRDVFNAGHGSAGYHRDVLESDPARARRLEEEKEVLPNPPAAVIDGGSAPLAWNSVR